MKNATALFLLLLLLTLLAAPARAQFSATASQTQYVCNAPGSQVGVEAFADGAGGSFVAWIDKRGGSNTGPNPVEQVLGALGNCLAVGYAANATAAGITIKDLRIAVEGRLDLHTFLGLKAENAGFNAITVVVTIDSDASPEALQTLHDKVTATSPVGHTLSRAVPLTIALA